MDETSYFDDEPSSPHYTTNGSSGSGLTLRLPPLLSSKSSKSGKRRKSSSFADQGIQAARALKPVKLKPLREVLSRLIVLIKKKDDYAFFLKPVDPRLVPGYAEIIQRPMDLGTISTKVAKGKYRSLEDFASDFRLVISNAKAFNPPGTIYHSEAERIEVFGLDRITKAAATVIEYETDWNIEIERDDDRSVAIDDDGEFETPAPTEENRRSPSVASNHVPGGRRGARTAAPATAATKKMAHGISESLEPDGSLPGAKDGLGAFPAGSDWARVMLALKIKGKKYRTKKERLRVEKSGPPMSLDGSLDYWEMEDPYTKLEALVPVPLFKPPLTPLHPFVVDFSGSSQFLVPSPVNVSLKRKIPHVSPELVAPYPKRRHWSISRNPTRTRPNQYDEEVAAPPWKAPREASTDDFGSFSTLMGDMVEDCSVQAVNEQVQLFDALRSSVSGHPMDSDQAVKEAHGYIQDVVYGGVDGFAYVQSLAAFIGGGGAEYHGPSTADGGLGMSLSRWVEESAVDYITQGRHRTLQDTVRRLRNSGSPAGHLPLEELLQILTQNIDISCLIRTPNDLLQADIEWSGREFHQERKRRLDLEKEESLITASGHITDPAEYLAFALQSHTRSDIDIADSLVDDRDDPETIGHVLDSTAKALDEMTSSNGAAQASAGANLGAEDAVARKLRLNLLALAKRMPVD